MDVNNGVTDNSSTSAGEGQTSAVPIENRFAELNRKFTQFQRQLDDKFGQLISSIQTVAQPGPVSKGVDETPIEGILKNNVSSIVDEKIMTYKHAESYQNALQSYPELDPNSDKFDQSFHALADRYYASLKSSGFADAPLKAVRMAALDLGKTEQLERERILADEAKRMRTLGEGTNSPRQGQKTREASYNQTLAGLLKVDTKGMDDFIKKNANKYRGR
jgi:hypothetical protein